MVLYSIGVGLNEGAGYAGHTGYGYTESSQAAAIHSENRTC